MTSDISHHDLPEHSAVPAVPSTGLASPPIPPTPPAAPGRSAGTSTAETAKDEVKNVAGTAVESGSQVLDTAKSETSEVVAQAGQSARELFDQVRDELTDQAGTQQHRVAAGLHDLAEELDRMSQSSGQSGQSGLAGSLVKQASDRTRSTAQWLEHRDPGDLVTEVKHYAARKPGTFLAAAAALGFLGARLTRGLTASSSTAVSPRPQAATEPASISAEVGGQGVPRVMTPAMAGMAETPGYPHEVAVPTVTTISHGEPVTYPTATGGTTAPTTSVSDGYLNGRP